MNLFKRYLLESLNLKIKKTIYNENNLPVFWSITLAHGKLRIVCSKVSVTNWECIDEHSISIDLIRD